MCLGMCAVINDAFINKYENEVSFLIIMNYNDLVSHLNFYYTIIVFFIQ